MVYEYTIENLIYQPIEPRLTLAHTERIKDSPIGEFILRLQEDYKLLDEFKKNPDKVMKDAGIKSEEIRNILKSGDLLRIEGLLWQNNELT